MEALCIGHCYIDLTIQTDYIPTGDEKYVAQDYAMGVGGNATVAAFALAHWGAGVDAVLPVAEDRLGDILIQRAARQGIRIFPRKVKRTSISLVLPNGDKRSILRCRDGVYLDGIPEINIAPYSVVHVDGHQPEAALQYVRQAREQGVLTSLDGGTVRPLTEEILNYIDVAVVSERFCQVSQKDPKEIIHYLLSKGVKVAAVTLGSEGLIYSEGQNLIHIPAIYTPPEEIVDTTGAGDIFHAAYLFSYMWEPKKSWHEHFIFARAAAALAIRRLGAETSIPAMDEIIDLVRQHPE